MRYRELSPRHPARVYICIDEEKPFPRASVRENRTPKRKQLPLPQAAVCGSGPPHKYGRPGELLSCDARGTTRRPVISSCRRQFSADPPLAPGFLKGPAGPLSRAPRLGTSARFHKKTKWQNSVCKAASAALSGFAFHKGVPGWRSHESPGGAFDRPNRSALCADTARHFGAVRL